MANKFYQKEAKIPKEEAKYREASELVDSIDCVLRFEWKVNALTEAAKIFRSLGEYKDAQEQAEACERRAGEVLQAGYEEVCGQALLKKKNAENKSDYSDAISDFKRVLKSEKHEAEAKEQIQSCKREILRIETKAVWKKRGIALLVLCVLAFLFYKSPAYSFTRGFLLQSQGDYHTAVKRYRAATAFPMTDRQLQKCYLEIGKEHLAKGEKKKALGKFRKADGVKEAQELAAGLEKEFLQEVSTGQFVRFGKLKWQVLKKKEDSVLLLCRSRGKKHPFYRKENAGFHNSYLGRWLNGAYKRARFSKYETALLEKIDLPPVRDGKKKGREYQISVLSEEEYQNYRVLMQPVKYPFWLKDERLAGTKVRFVKETGEIGETEGAEESCYARPVICVNIKQENLEK